MRLEELISENDIKLKTRELAERISSSIPDSGQPIILLGILKGSVHFLSDLSRTLWELGRECQLEFMQVSSWHGATSSSGVVQIKKDIDSSIENRDVVIVEDILDTGRTLSHLRDLLGTRHPKSLQICTLLSKKPMVGYLVARRLRLQEEKTHALLSVLESKGYIKAVGSHLSGDPYVFSSEQAQIARTSSARLHAPHGVEPATDTSGTETPAATDTAAVR